jgi:glycosyltransferase involved in cell wall biosynthesis
VQALLGSLAFSSDGLGVTPGNPLSLIQASESPEEAKLIDAWRAWGPSAPELLIVGDGPLRSGMERAASGLNVSFTGALPAAETQRLIAQSRLLLIPSEWFEGFPMALREAFALGTAVAASRIGPLPSLLGDGRFGLLFDPFDPMDLLQVVRAAWEDESRVRAFAESGRREFLDKYNDEANYAVLMAIYERAIGRAQERLP